MANLHVSVDWFCDPWGNFIYTTVTMNWNIFKSVIYINLDHRQDKNEDIQNTLRMNGCSNYQRSPGVLLENRMLGFNHAQLNALNIAEGPALILEDDVTFTNVNIIELAMQELPKDWDIMYLGANVVGTDLCSWPEPEYYSQFLRRVSQAWTTHAVAYSQKGLDYILSHWTPGDQMYDDWLRCNLEKMQAFITYPMVADQRKGYSDIWQRDVDYGFFNKWSQ
jgi:hypothetical protein